MLRLSLLVGVGLLAPQPGAGTEAIIERCRQAGNADARIACLEAALRADPAAALPPPAERELGAEQVQPHADEDEQRIAARTVAIRFVGRDKLLVELDSGQIWRQIDSDRTDLSRRLRNETQLDVELWRSKFGGYRLLLSAVDRSIKVKRLR